MLLQFFIAIIYIPFEVIFPIQSSSTSDWSLICHIGRVIAISRLLLHVKPPINKITISLVNSGVYL